MKQTKISKRHVILYSDGACCVNPGKGGYGAILKYGDAEKELTKGFKLTTNNRMELLGVIEPLEALKESCKVTVYTDSQYVAYSVSKGWLNNWVNNNWKKSNKKKALNIDLWQRMLPLLEEHEIEFKWIKGHNNNHYNERCDQIAVQACYSSELIDDEGYKPKKDKQMDLFK